jgi:hypothetical protein
LVHLAILVSCLGPKAGRLRAVILELQLKDVCATIAKNLPKIKSKRENIGG